MTTEKKKTIVLSVFGNTIKGEATNMSRDEVLCVLIATAIIRAKELCRSVCVKRIMSDFGFDVEGCPDED